MKTEQLLILREICRLVLTSSHSINEIARMFFVSSRRVSRIRRKLKKLNLTLELVDSYGDQQLKKLLYPKQRNRYVRRIPNWCEIHEKMGHKCQTLAQLWEEYRLINPVDAFSYSQFTYHYAKFRKTVDVTMRMTHQPGECVFVDYAGLTIPWQDGDVEKNAHIFVAVSGASNGTFSLACRDQSTASWIDAHNKMFTFFGGVHQVVVPDNLKAAVIKPGSFPILNRTYLDMARHYGITIAPARVRRPQDKSKAEAGVLFVSRWITAPLRRRKFFSLEEINEAISELLPALNERKFRRLEGSRWSRFLAIDKPALKPLPAKPFECVTWVHEQRVPPDYHVYIEGHAYSVPYQYVGKMVEACYSLNSVQFFHDHERIVSHRRSFEKNGRTLDDTHMPHAHKAYSERQLSDFLMWSKGIGVYAISAVEAQFAGKPNYSYTAAIACDKLKRLCTLYGAERFESACKRASLLQSLTVKTIRSILTRKVDSLEIPESLGVDSLPIHQNLRGADYYTMRGDMQ